MAYCIVEYVDPSTKDLRRRGRADGGGGGGVVIDPTINAGSLALGAASYSVPALHSWYVDSVNGSDSNTGTSGSPKKSVIATIAAAAGSGDAIVLRGNTDGTVREYNEGWNTQTANDRSTAVAGQSPTYLYSKSYTIQNYPGEAAAFDGSTVMTGSWTADGATGFWYHPYTMRFDRSHTLSSGTDDVDSGTAQSGGKYVDDTLNPIAANPDQVFLDGVQMTQVQNKAQLGPGKFWVEGTALTSPNNKWFQGTNVWVGTNPAGHEMRYSNKCGLLQTGASIYPITIKGVGIRRYASFMPGFGVLYMTSSNCLLENVIMEDIAASCVWHQGTASPWTSGITYRHVTARRVGYAFLGGGSTDATMVDSCDFDGINYRNFSPVGPSLATIKIQASQGITVQNTKFTSSNCTGFWTDRTVGNPKVLSCRFQDLGRGGIDFEGASDCYSINNFFQNMQQYAVWVNDSDQVHIWNNTSVDALLGVVGGSPFCVVQSSRRADSATWSWMHDGRQTTAYYSVDPHRYVCNHYDFYNNVVVQTQASKGQAIFSCQDGSDTTSIDGTTRTFQPSFGPHMDSNVYYWLPGSLTYGGFITANGGGKNPTVDFSLATFKSATGLEPNGTQSNTNPVNGVGQLLDVNLHGKATGLPSDIADMINQPIGAKRAGAFLVGDA